MSTQIRGDVDIKPLTITNAQIATAAAIAYSKLAALTAGSIPFVNASGVLTQDNAQLFWDATNKRFGIGTSTPNVPLEVVAAQASVNFMSTTGTFKGLLQIGQVGGPIVIGMNGDASNLIVAGSTPYAGVFGHYGNFPLQFAPNSTVRMTIDSATGYVGIGTAPAYALDVAGAVIQVTNTVAPSLRVNLGTGTASFATFGFYEGATEVANLQYIGSTFATAARRGDMQLSGARVVLVPSTGFTLINADTSITPSRVVTIGTAARTWTGIELNAHATTWVLDHRGTIDSPNDRFHVGTDAASNLLSLLRTGNLGLSVATPTATLHLRAGTATASSAPQKFTAGTLLTTPEAGALEWVDNGTTGHLYITQNVAGVLTRVQIV